ncbi:MAG TPA: hypothetical protein VGN34_12760 [Ktedonobacteraceae bacterium]|jgi:uncharacterized membrane protein YhiD involved in acid resistance
MGFNPFKRGQSNNSPAQPVAPAPQPAAPAGPQTGPNTQPLAPGAPQFSNLDDINLVNYTPDDLMKHVQDTMSTVDFGMANTTKFTHGIASAWSVAGPAMLAAGTAGEVFTVIWTHTKAQEQTVGTAIVVWIAVLAMEISFAVTTYLAANIRHRIGRKVNGATTEDKANLARHKNLWYVLAVGIAASQGVFLMTSLTGASGAEMGLLMVFAVLRPLATMASDYGTAFVHEEKPTTADEALRIQEEREQLASKLLHQKTKEVTIINDGTLALQKAHTLAAIEQDTLRTELAVKSLENRNRVETLENQAKQAQLLTGMSNNIMRALFDPEVSDEDKKRTLGIFLALSHANNELPAPKIDKITEEDDF